ncbi:DUF4135 domain-containing protein [Actinoplanes sp. M2I2]|uniref:DUF4135 domain-containing protein n=1 Tax=Actinoplanes sp. M2I2 TaxID=1734444 RepID=UPI002020EAF0|nr:DUF4135 domain-containing protein [Actinoplanes sp. M2I2]
MNPSVSIEAFLPFYRHVVPREAVTGRLRAAVTGVAAPEHVEAVLDQVWSDVAGRVEQQSFRVLIGEFHRFRPTVEAPALRRFSDWLAGPAGAAGLLERYPVLRERLETSVRQSLEPYAEVFAALAADRAALHEAGLTPDPSAPVMALFGTGGDLHNDNRKVVGLRLADGTRLLYKPRDLLSDAFLRDLYAAVDPYLRFSLRDCLPRSVAGAGYGWQEYVEPRPMTGADQPARYFYRFGAICAVLGSIGASDLHDENLIAGGEHPTVIDTETVVRPDAGVDDDTLPHRLINHLKLSIASTLLVPMLDPGSANDLNMSGVGVDGVQVSRMKRPVVRDGDNDDIAVHWEPVTYRHRDNLPRLGDGALAATAHFADIRAGYLDALAAIRDDAAGKVLDAYPQMPVRCLIRSTRVYARYIDAATHPDYLRDHDDAERLLGLLRQYPPYLSEQAAAWVGEQERDSLRAGNVPLFVARAGHAELATTRSRVDGVHRWTALDFARRGLAQSAARPDDYHHFLLEESFGELAGPGELCASSVFAPVLADARPRGWWPEIARVIERLGISYDGPDGPELGWVAGVGPDRGASTLTPGHCVSFHDAGGIVTFLGHAAALDPGLAAAHRAADRGLDALLADYADPLLQAPESVLTGAASMRLVRPDRVDQQWQQRTAAAFAARAAAGALETDLGNGPAGLLMLSLGTGLDAGVDADLLAELTRAHLPVPRDKPWYDVAHGELGLRWALARLGRARGDDAAADASADWLIERLGCPDQPPVTGWCNGSAGLLLSAAEILATAGRPLHRLAPLVEAATRLPRHTPVDLSVCHGTSGVVQALLATGRILGADEAYAGLAADYQQRVVAAARRQGFATGASGRTALLGYLLGWSGVGDTDLLIEHAARGELAGRVIPVALGAPQPL